MKEEPGFAGFVGCETVTETEIATEIEIEIENATDLTSSLDCSSF